MEIKLKDHEIAVKNLKVDYRTAGDTKNSSLIFLNGWGARLGGVIVPSDKIIKEFAKTFYVYSPEHPGLMRSETPEKIWGFPEYAEYLAEFVEKLGINNFILVGQSFGGAIATAYAALYPQRIKTLVLVNAGLSFDKRQKFFIKGLGAITYLSPILRSKYAPGFLKKVFVWAALGVPWRHIEKESFEARSIMGEIFHKWRLDDLYSKIKVKTIFIWGKNDILFPLASAELAAKETPNAQIFAVGGGHSVLYTRPGKIINLICEKLTEN